MTLTITGLRKIEKYDLALFGCDSYSGFGGRGATFAIAGHGSKYTTADFTDLDSNGFKNGDTHVLFYNVSPDSNGEIVVTITREPGEDIVPFNGVQIGRLYRKPFGTVMVLR
jgi:hypothetical protein